MKPGRKLDVLVGEEVMGWTVKTQPGGSQLRIWGSDTVDDCTPLALWSPSTDIAAAWEVVEKMDGWWMESEWSAETGKQDLVRAGVELDGKIGEWVQETAPYAVCLAALEAVGIDAKELA